MPRPEFFAPPGYGVAQRERFHYSQAVRIGDRVELAGQGGWTDEFDFPPTLAAEIALAFDNVGRMLAAAGASWDGVVSLTSYHLPIGDEPLGYMVAEMRARMPKHAPIWTAVGVAGLGNPRMHVEIAVTAILP